MDILERLADRGSTHWTGCEAKHTDCAAAKEITELRKQAKALERDKARLEALLSHDWEVVATTRDPESWALLQYGTVIVKGPTARTVIDAAMSAEEAGSDG